MHVTVAKDSIFQRSPLTPVDELEVRRGPADTLSVWAVRVEGGTAALPPQGAYVGVLTIAVHELFDVLTIGEYAFRVKPKASINSEIVPLHLA